MNQAVIIPEKASWARYSSSQHVWSHLVIESKTSNLETYISFCSMTNGSVRVTKWLSTHHMHRQETPNNVCNVCINKVIHLFQPVTALKLRFWSLYTSVWTEEITLRLISNEKTFFKTLSNLRKNNSLCVIWWLPCECFGATRILGPALLTKMFHVIIKRNRRQLISLWGTTSFWRWWGHSF